MKKNGFNQPADILVAIGEPSLFDSYCQQLVELGYHVMLVSSGELALKYVAGHPIQLLILDAVLPDRNSLQLLREVKEQSPLVEVIFTCKEDATLLSPHALYLGAFTTLSRPFSFPQLEEAINRALGNRSRLEKMCRQLALGSMCSGCFIIGRHSLIRNLHQFIHCVANSEATVLIYGESGTGKDLVAKALHQCSYRKDQPFQVLNSAALPPELLESELFGYERGAFTGAVTTRIGLVEEAAGGTLFLDEIGEMDLSIQAKLLRFLENGEFRRIGSNILRKVKVRVVAATNRDLQQAVSEGKFREDLYYRLSIVTIQTPPLREHPCDIPLLAQHFLHLYTPLGKEKRLAEDAWQFLDAYEYPGNVRELSNMIERGILLSEGELIHAEHLQGYHDYPTLKTIPRIGMMSLDQDLTLATMERHHIQCVLQLVEGNKTQAAQQLGISISTLYRKIEEYQISDTSNGTHETLSN
ncbi:sigma-54-dependent transcriptional regulator [Rubeoparvulum massiliense]|uniref:sigma-54-dependent transcriptional regulator n=1 Tax=Rubeoparvulum massiliense TaxID=1631346 RepID=UPI00065E71B3|nr:sigma-54 dependent transcriptional regulator [Rubeoparvulum massiliense]